MTAAEWENCAAPVEMLSAAKGLVLPAAVRLVVCELVAMDSPDAPALPVARKMALGGASDEERTGARRAVIEACGLGGHDGNIDLLAEAEGRYLAVEYGTAPVGDDPAGEFASAFRHYHGLRGDETVRDHLLFHRPDPADECALIRELLGNPFRPVAFDPVWLTSTVLLLAEGIRRDRALDRMPVLGDALDDAGCSDATVLAHCRRDGPHHAGCWVLNVLLGVDCGAPDLIDPLTGLANRRAFGANVSEAAHRAGVGRTPLSVLALDLDGFRRINSTYGLRVGDRMLTEVAGLMRAALTGNLLARTGGDRFGVVLRGHDLPAALRVAERLRQLVEEWRWSAPDLGVRDESLTISVGAAALGFGAAGTYDLHRDADAALHRAQAAGRNRVSR